MVRHCGLPFLWFGTVITLGLYLKQHHTWPSPPNATKIYRPWIGDPECEDLSISFAVNLPKMSLASYPGSGNTWIRGIIERLTGIFTGSLYDDEQLYAKGFYGELVPVDCGCTVLQKTHLYPQDHTEIESAEGVALLIIRNPYRALVSFRNFESSGQGHVQLGSTRHFSGPDWEKFVSDEIVNWKEMAIYWIESIRHGGVLHYENLIHNRESEFRKLLRYVMSQQPGIVKDERRIDCALKHDFRVFKRNETTSDGSTEREPEDLFSLEQIKVIDRAINEVHALLVRKGYDPIPFHYYTNRILS